MHLVAMATLTRCDPSTVSLFVCCVTFLLRTFYSTSSRSPVWKVAPILLAALPLEARHPPDVLFGLICRR